PSMHEVVFSDAIQKKNGVNTMDIAKRLIDYGFHPYTTAFPLIVPGALMIEPTESESKEECDLFIDAMKAIAEEAATKPEIVKTARGVRRGLHNFRLRRGFLRDGLHGIDEEVTFFLGLRFRRLDHDRARHLQRRRRGLRMIAVVD